MFQPVLNSMNLGFNPIHCMHFASCSFLLPDEISVLGHNVLILDSFETDRAIFCCYRSLLIQKTSYHEESLWSNCQGPVSLQLFVSRFSCSLFFFSFSIWCFREWSAYLGIWGLLVSLKINAKIVASSVYIHLSCSEMVFCCCDFVDKWAIIFFSFHFATKTASGDVVYWILAERERWTRKCLKFLELNRR